jgi:gliding motility-associated lipoprotein GldH
MYSKFVARATGCWQAGLCCWKAFYIFGDKYSSVVYNFPHKSFARKSLNVFYVLLAATSLQLATLSCTTVDLYEKSVVIPNHAWQSNFKPSFTFVIKDTTQQYQLYLVLRHTEKYNFNNIYIKLKVQKEGGKSAESTWDVSLADQEQGWKASGMNDIYEHRTAIGVPVYYEKGTYTFTLEQIMREDPLQHVLNAGIRIEKK